MDIYHKKTIIMMKEKIEALENLLKNQQNENFLSDYQKNEKNEEKTHSKVVLNEQEKLSPITCEQREEKLKKKEKVMLVDVENEDVDVTSQVNNIMINSNKCKSKNKIKIKRSVCKSNHNIKMGSIYKDIDDARW
eukprot:CAMPEP_0118686540 /NCGR_PEP_ID=MMETSP0800-20121206/7869_1 /TAXON_ID=210618 ORGANISM="Striatella unipunctata, Strain CCMP2910" /NCGR_SAMPLE_ID=MMETSP0800 /ASSEMBLY_ACC=CAM_ASM_000638 /LENGTH=134 /DNA_ID=CAMNT_0006583595 /DNA_START=259 /DNA_END=660 /DNA_ORIENTATION=+